MGTTQTFYFHTQVGLLGEYTRLAGTTQVPTIAREYVYSGSKAVAMVTGPYVASWTYSHTDRLGSVRKRTADNRGVILTRDYYPFGEEVVQTASNEKKFTGYYRDGESNLDYAMNRYYNLGIGRFQTPDPFNIGSVQLPCGSKGMDFPKATTSGFLSNAYSGEIGHPFRCESGRAFRRQTGHRFRTKVATHSDTKLATGSARNGPPLGAEPNGCGRCHCPDGAGSHRTFSRGR